MELHDRFAKEGYVWVCQACGKVSPYDRYGDASSDKWWDSSCVLSSIMVREDCLVRDENGRVIEIRLQQSNEDENG